jgi:hypothetical protein
MNDDAIDRITPSIINTPRASGNQPSERLSEEGLLTQPLVDTPDNLDSTTTKDLFYRPSPANSVVDLTATPTSPARRSSCTSEKHDATSTISVTFNIQQANRVHRARKGCYRKRSLVMDNPRPWSWLPCFQQWGLPADPRCLCSLWCVRKDGTKNCITGLLYRCHVLILLYHSWSCCRDSLCQVRLIYPGPSGTTERVQYLGSSSNLVTAFRTYLSCTCCLGALTCLSVRFCFDLCVLLTFDLFIHFVRYYNMALSLCYLLKCVHGWTEERLKKYEIPFHIVGFGLPLLVAVGALFLDFYHALPLTRRCGVSAYPRGCLTNDITCTEGEYSTLYIWAVSFPVGFSPLIVSCVSTGMIYLAVRKQDKRSQSHSFPGSTNEHADRKLNAVLTQCMFYILVVINMMFWCVLLRILELFNFGPQNEARIYPIVVMSQLSCRSQGISDLLVYLHPRYLAQRERGLSFAAAEVT